MSSKITGKEYPLLKIFSFDFEYHIPAYQRPHAWITEEAGILFDDLYEFYRTELSDNYFLGTIVLIKEEDKGSYICNGDYSILCIVYPILPGIYGRNFYRGNFSGKSQRYT